ncbi:hypothetical protein [Micromonospora zhanjiangensis]|uniref:AP2/ERF domain-containing protein n=1 Tax=Micromonospora zhanjiangensis TaxID=1522057 RepID=A0ABV8KVA8_9ACTN
MEKFLHYVLLDAARAAVIWVLLIGLAVVAMAGLVRRRERGTATDPDQADHPGPRDAEAAELHRYAEEVAVAAERAAATARRRRAEWLAAQDEAETARPALAEAEAIVRRLALAAAFPPPRTPRTPAEYADRERFMHRAVMAAYWRRELTVRELVDALDHSNGWDPRRHPVEQELVLRKVIRDRLAALERAAVDRERLAWQTADTAAEAARALREEAYAAARRAEAAGRRTRPIRSRVRTVTDPTRVRRATDWLPARTG